MMRLVLFVFATILLAVVSRKSLLHPASHGFTRFFAFESITALTLLNIPFWFVKPFAPHQVVSWLLLVISVPVVIEGARLLRSVGRRAQERDDASLFAFEKTSRLVTVGIYRYIRHPLYASLLLLSSGVFLKHVSWQAAVLYVSSLLFLYATAKRDEAECIQYFGEEYRAYMRLTRMFLPFFF